VSVRSLLVLVRLTNVVALVRWARPPIALDHCIKLLENKIVQRSYQEPDKLCRDNRAVCRFYSTRATVVIQHHRHYRHHSTSHCTHNSMPASERQTNTIRHVSIRHSIRSSKIYREVERIQSATRNTREIRQISTTNTKNHTSYTEVLCSS
jgi:hypothetical protein